ncbi:MAG: nicotinate-nucleotide adenylyltransferase [Nitrospira sp.]|nr:nicotinate-nucleotide adenylyltransferase [Nitrospira sp.]
MKHSPHTRIGVLGGAFNPVHHGHLAMATHAQQVLALDQVLFIPSGDHPPHKAGTTLAPAHHRLAMVKHAIADRPHFTVSDIEARASSTSYTVETIHTLRQCMKGVLWFLIGLDAFLQIASWRSVATLISSTNFLVLSRPTARFSQVTSLTLLPPPPTEQLDRLDDGTRTRLDVSTGPHAVLTLLRMPPCQVSASAIRTRIQEGLDVTDWLPPSVHSYIIRHRVYGLREGET